MKVLITGGAGYIGSHCNRYFNEQGIETVVVDDLSDGHEEAVVAGKFVKGDFGDAKLMKELFKKEKVDAVVHFAAFASVPDSVARPSMLFSLLQRRLLVNLNTFLLMRNILKSRLTHTEPLS